MNRRDFFKFSASSIVIGSTQQIMAYTEPNLDIYIQDHITLNRKDCKQLSENILQKKPVLAFDDEKLMLKTISLKLKQAQRTVGYGNFNLLGFDDLLRTARHNSKIGSFTKQELNYIEKIFYTEAKDYGFYGQKVTNNLTENISKRDTVKIPYTGHYLYKGEPYNLYELLKKEVGPSIILTSGVRSVVKQLDLFLYKANTLEGNYSEAAHSLAPPGYSFHGVSDFDVGKVGFGYKNFTSSFSKTSEYRSLQKLGYVSIRYPEGNPFGVRFEPWHIKV